jgi:hypothetical protein
MKKSIAVIVSISTLVLAGCSTTCSLKGEFATQEAEVQKLGPGISQWFYTGTALGVHRLVLSHKNKMDDGRIAEHACITEVPVSQFAVANPFPLTLDENRWRQIDSPAR